MAGIVDYIPSGFEGDPGTAFLELLMIARPFRRQGLGKAAVEAVESEIRKDSRVKAIKSGVQVNNPEAIRFWERMGYRITSGPRHHPDLTTGYDLIKELA
jgi:ribosomal protein S18 acetylase RimI-like enzyme